MDHIDAGHHLEQLARHMRGGPVAGRCHAELARISLGVGDELRNRLGRNRWVHDHDDAASGEGRDRRDVADKIEIEFLIERCVDRIVTPDHEQRVAVCRRVHDRLGADVGAATRPVVDYELLAEPLRQPLADQAGRDVVRAGGRDRHDQTHRPRWIGLRPSDARDGRQRSSACGEMQKLSAGKYHSALPAFQATVSRHHSGLILAARITLPHFSVSSAISLPKSAGEPTNTVPPSSASLALILGSARPALISWLSLTMISAGVLLGALIATNALASKPGMNSPSVGTFGS